jgi:hypothetical protein
MDGATVRLSGIYSKQLTFNCSTDQWRLLAINS